MRKLTLTLLMILMTATMNVSWARNVIPDVSEEACKKIEESCYSKTFYRREGRPICIVQQVCERPQWDSVKEQCDIITTASVTDTYPCSDMDY